MQLLLNEVARIERTMQGVVDSALPTTSNPRQQDIRGAVAAAIEVVQSRADICVGVAIHSDRAPEALFAAIDRDQFLSLLTNLLINALDASPEGSTVEVSSAGGKDDMIRVTVSDSGPGLDPAIADKLFTPFATSKPSGTGLGLTIARKIAQEHGGELTVTSRAEAGTTFTLILPKTEP